MSRPYITILVDHSGSMLSKYSACVQGVCDVAKQVRSDGQPFDLRIVFFSDELDGNGGVGVVAYTGVSGDFAAARVKETSALLPCSGGTRYYDSVVQEVKQAADRESETTVIVATDGRDTSSSLETEHTCREAVERFRGAGGRLVYLGMADTALDRSHLQRSARQSGVAEDEIAVGPVLPLVRTMRSVSVGGAVGGAAGVAQPQRLNLHNDNARSRSMPLPTLARQRTHS